MKVISFFIFLFALSLSAQDLRGQAIDALLEHRNQVKERVDSVIDNSQKILTDTNYIARPTTPWTIKIRERIYGNFISVRGNVEGVGDIAARINAPRKRTFGVSVNYRGLSLSLSMNPARLFGKNDNQTYGLTYYNNHFGADLMYSDVSDLSTKTQIGDEQWELALTDSHLRFLSGTVYYVFNGKRFSYPASFCHSWIQRRSAGSFLISVSYYQGWFNSNYDDETTVLTREKRIDMGHIAIGGGYAYNYVPNHRWLLHVSAMPYLALWHNYRYKLLTLDPSEEPALVEIPLSKPGIQILGRMGVTRSWKRHFMGLNGVVQSSKVGIEQDLTFGNTLWKGELFMGFRL